MVPAMIRGSVTRFDAAAGLGAITGDDDTTYEFQCIEIADGSRAIDVGQRVGFHPLPRLGRVQAGQIEKW